MQRSLPLSHETRGQTNILREIINAGENCIEISNSREVINKIHGPYIKPSSWNRNRIQQPMRTSSEVLALLIHATILDELFYIGDHKWLQHIINMRLEHFKNAYMAHKVTAMKLGK